MLYEFLIQFRCQDHEITFQWQPEKREEKTIFLTVITCLMVKYSKFQRFPTSERAKHRKKMWITCWTVWSDSLNKLLIKVWLSGWVAVNSTFCSHCRRRCRCLTEKNSQSRHTIDIRYSFSLIARNSDVVHFFFRTQRLSNRQLQSEVICILWSIKTQCKVARRDFQFFRKNKSSKFDLFFTFNFQTQQTIEKSSWCGLF